jgi:hypothetical protein
MQTMRLTHKQSLRIADLPERYRVVGLDDSAPFVRCPSGEIMRILRDGSLTAATREARHRLRDADGDPAGYVAEGVTATTPYTSVMD